jgi:hypothetical protein|eukprot:COSAG01_NODE_37_length_34085_cov_64.376626_10_plen_57_part_00
MLGVRARLSQARMALNHGRGHIAMQKRRVAAAARGGGAGLLRAPVMSQTRAPSVQC